ncbi:MAG: sigma-70 family RNA polymerase sigma factor [Casimicrobiaceae bacterium]
MAESAAQLAARESRNSALEALLARTALADQRAFAELYRLTSAHLFGVALRIVRERSIAEEILQEAFVNVWNHAASYAAARSRPLTWLTAVVRNRCLDQVRHRELATVTLSTDDNDGAAPFDPPSTDPSPAELLMRGADAQSVRECVESLEGGTRQAIALAFFQGLSHAELATHLGQPLGTVKSWVRRGLERLKGCLDALGVTA